MTAPGSSPPAIAAVYPYLWVNDGLIMSEAFAAAAVDGRAAPDAAAAPATVARARARARRRVRARGARARRARPARAAARPPAARELPGGRRGRAGSRSSGRSRSARCCSSVRGSRYNLSRFDDPTFLSTNDGIAMLGVELRPGVLRSGDRADAIWPVHPEARTRGRPVGRVADLPRPRVRLHERRTSRARRSWSSRASAATGGCTGPRDMLDWNQNEGRPRWVTGLGMVFYYPLLAFAIGGVVVLRRRRTRQWPLLVPPLIVTRRTVLAYGQTRFRVPAEPSLVVLAAVGIAALVARWWPEPASGRGRGRRIRRAESSTIVGELLELIDRAAGVVLEAEQALVEQVDVVLPGEADAAEHLDRAGARPRRASRPRTPGPWSRRGGARPGRRHRTPSTRSTRDARASSTARSMSAHRCCTAWNVPIGTSNCRRSLAYSTASSSAPRRRADAVDDHRRRRAGRPSPRSPRSRRRRRWRRAAASIERRRWPPCGCRRRSASA